MDTTVRDDLAKERTSLAQDRTILANKRTLLAFIRTALMSFVSAITFIKLFHGDFFLVVTGWILIPISVLTLVVGFQSYYKMQKDIFK